MTYMYQKKYNSDLANTGFYNSLPNELLYKYRCKDPKVLCGYI